MPAIAKGQLASSQVTHCHEDLWVSQSSPRLAAVKRPIVVLLCAPLPPPGSLRSGHGEMSSSLGGIWSLSPKNRRLQRSCIPDPAHVAFHLSSDHLIGLSITASEQSHVKICAPGQYCMNIFVSGQSYSQMSFIFIYF